jgi:hypothetical protein
MATRRTVRWVALLAAVALACGAEHRPTASECHLVGWYGLTDTLASADDLCARVLGDRKVENVSIAEDSPGTFKWQPMPETTIWNHGTIDANCQAHLEWNSDNILFIGADGQEIPAPVHDVRTFRVDAAGVLSGTITRTVTPSAPYPGLPCTWTGTSSG